MTVDDLMFMKKNRWQANVNALQRKRFDYGQQGNAVFELWSAIWWSAWWLQLVLMSSTGRVEWSTQRGTDTDIRSAFIGGGRRQRTATASCHLHHYQMPFHQMRRRAQVEPSHQSGVSVTFARHIGHVGSRSNHAAMHSPQKMCYAQHTFVYRIMLIRKAFVILHEHSTAL